MSFMNELFTFINAQPWIPGHIAFDVKPQSVDDPYFNMLAITDAGLTGEFCASDSGQTIVQFNGYGTSRYTLHDAMDQLRKDVLKARNALPSYSLWHLRTTGVIGYGTEDVSVYRFTFELQCMWRINT